MAAHQFGNPSGVKKIHAGVVNDAKLFPRGPIRAQVSAALDGEARAVSERQRHCFAVAWGTRCPMASPAKLLDRLGPQVTVVAAEKDRCQERQGTDLAAVQPFEHHAEVTAVV